MKKLLLILSIIIFSQSQAFAIEPFLGQMIMVGFNFCPRGYSLADGQILPINQNQSLYSLLGTQFGGDGRTHFRLPDLRGRAPVHVNPSSSLPNVQPFVEGQQSGVENVNLTISELPSHNHSLVIKGGNPSTKEVVANPGTLYFAEAPIYRYGGTNTVTHVNSTSSAGGSQAHNNMQPYQTINYCIATVGLFPPRN